MQPNTDPIDEQPDRNPSGQLRHNLIDGKKLADFLTINEGSFFLARRHFRARAVCLVGTQSATLSRKAKPCQQAFIADGKKLAEFLTALEVTVSR